MGVAVFCSELASFSALKLQERPALPAPGPKQVKIAVEAAGVNYVDLLLLAGKYQWRPPLPFVPGLEVAGKIAVLGKECRRLQPKQPVYAACSIGGYASEVIVDEEQAFSLPAGLSMPEAATSVCSFGTAYHALTDRGALQKGERLLVLGASGGVGAAALQIGRMLEAEVIAVSTKAKEAYVKEQGAAQVLSDDIEVLQTQLKDLPRVHVVLDALGGAYSEPAFRALLPGGRHLVLGFVTGSIARLPLNLPLLKMADLRGVFWSRFRTEYPALNRKNFGILSNAFANKQLKPCLGKIYPLAECKKALIQLKKRAVCGKQALIIDPKR